MEIQGQIKDLLEPFWWKLIGLRVLELGGFPHKGSFRLGLADQGKKKNSQQAEFVEEQVLGF